MIKIIHLIKQANICSEAVSDIYVVVGFDIVPDLDNGTTLPKDLANGRVRRL